MTGRTIGSRNLSVSNVCRSSPSLYEEQLDVNHLREEQIFAAYWHGQDTICKPIVFCHFSLINPDLNNTMSRQQKNQCGEQHLQEFSLNYIQLTLNKVTFQLCQREHTVNSYSELSECEDNINAQKFIKIFGRGLLPIFSNDQLCKATSLFMKNGDPCYSANSTRICQKNNIIKELPRASKSHDMNLIEHPLANLNEKIGRMPQKLFNKGHLMPMLRELRAKFHRALSLLIPPSRAYNNSPRNNSPMITRPTAYSRLRKCLARTNPRVIYSSLR